MSQTLSPGADEPPARRGGGLLDRWNRTPLYLRIVAALIVGVFVGVVLGERAHVLEIPSKLILRLLGALAPPLILVAVVHALMNTQVRGPVAARLAGLLVLNTVVAILIGLLVANVLRPGRFANLKPKPAATASTSEADPAKRQILETLEKYGYKPSTTGVKDPVTQFLDNVPKSLLGPLTENNVIGVILIAIAFGLALRSARDTPVRTLGDWVEIAFGALLKVLHWVIAVVPLGVFGIVASIIGTEGFRPFGALGFFILAVLLALFLQAGYYLLRVRLGSWVRPGDLLRGTRDALTLAFSTASSTVTMPVTYACLRDRVGLREESASLGALVGANFNNDGTALYEAMSALFVSQLLGMDLSLPHQLIVVLTSIVASVGAAGIPEAGLVTMTLVFTAVGLDVRFIAVLLTVDWFLDRCRTTINVLGDMNVSCLLDGKHRKSAAEEDVAPAEAVPA
jgi:Na+/H+-dicarboxylate symporter